MAPVKQTIPHKVSELSISSTKSRFFAVFHDEGLKEKQQQKISDDNNTTSLDLFTGNGTKVYHVPLSHWNYDSLLSCKSKSRLSYLGIVYLGYWIEQAYLAL